MAGYDPADSASVNHSIPNYRAALTGNVSGVRVGLLRHFYTTDNEASHTTRHAIDAAAKKLEEMGCKVHEIQLSPLSEWAACGGIILMAEGYATHETNLRSCFTDYGEVFRFPYGFSRIDH